jgi:hypothetical protein
MEMLRKFLAALFAASLLLVPAACSDEDGDGATTDEEVDEIDEGTEDLGNELEEEVDQGEEEVDENDQ